jgi:hypothetical protein
MDRSQRLLAGIALIGLCGPLGSTLALREGQLPFWSGVALICTGLAIGIMTLREYTERTYRYIDGGVLKRDTNSAILRLQQRERRDVMAESPDRDAFFLDGWQRAARSYWVRSPVLRRIRFHLDRRTLRRNEERRRDRWGGSGSG